MSDSRIKTFVVGVFPYEAARFTGFGPADVEIYQWLTKRMAGKAINLDKPHLIKEGLAFSNDTGKTYLIVRSGYSRFVKKRIKPGRWVVRDVTLGRLSLLTNKEFKEKFGEKHHEPNERIIQQYVMLNQPKPEVVQALRLRKDNVEEIIKLFLEDNNLLRYSVDLVAGQLTLEVGFEHDKQLRGTEWFMSFGQWCVKSGHQYAWMTDYQFKTTYTAYNSQDLQAL